MADLHISFWDDGLTANYLSLCFGEADLDALWQYLRLVTGEADLSDPRVRFGWTRGPFCRNMGAEGAFSASKCCRI